MKRLGVALTAILCLVLTNLPAQSNEPAFQTKNGTYYFTNNKPIELKWGSTHFFRDSITKHKTNGDTAVSYSINSVVDAKYASTDISVYPNPFIKTVNIKYEKDGDLIIELIDITGKYTMHKTLSSSNRSLDLSNLVASTYILKVYDANMQLLQTFKIEKVK